MAAISAKEVKKLRDMTGVGMMACKKALVETDGDLDAAVEVLRKAGVAKAAKKAGRSATQGVIVSCIGDGAGVLAEVLCETDFVAKTDRFREFAQGVAAKALADYDTDGDISAQVAETVKTELTDLIGVIGENMQVRRVLRWTTGGTCASYLHMGGKLAVLIDTEGEGGSDELLNEICMHVAAFNPQYIVPEDVPEDVLEKEKEIAAAQVAGKPEHIIGKIVMGKINKWYSETCLTRQPWIKDDKSCLAKVAPKLSVKRFVRWQVGEAL